MAKKQKRQVSRSTPAQGGMVDVVIEKNTGAARTTGSFEFNPDYAYVKKDLKRIGALAGTFFVILIALSFFIK